MRSVKKKDIYSYLYLYYLYLQKCKYQGEKIKKEQRAKNTEDEKYMEKCETE